MRLSSPSTEDLRLDEGTKRLVHNHKLLGNILAALDEARFGTSELSILAKKIEDLYSIEANKVIQIFPDDLWNYIFKKASLCQTGISQLLSLRLVSQTWNNIICGFPKVNTQTLLNKFKLFQIFPGLKYFDLPESKTKVKKSQSASIPFSLLTGLQTLSIPTRKDISPDMSEFAPLTNLTELTLTGSTITSLGPLTSLQILFLKKPYSIKAPELDKLPHLTKVTSDRKDILLSRNQTPYKKIYKGSGFTYEGEWQKDQHSGLILFHGKGVLTHSDGSRYEGDFKNDALDGNGTFYYASGSVYIGQFYDGLRHGHGVETSPIGDRFEGAWVNDKKNGHGVYHYHNGDRYSCCLLPHSPRNFRYEGNFKGGHRSGHGWFYYSNGDEYEGNWDRKRNGYGVLKFANGDRYVPNLALRNLSNLPGIPAARLDSSSSLPLASSLAWSFLGSPVRVSPFLLLFYSMFD
jgi:hypothetical protein